MARLGVNIDHVATIRQARGGTEPEPVTAAALCELAGADGITIHLREDRRHIQDRDLRLLRETVQTSLNLEMAATDEMIDIALAVRPDYVTLVPEKRQELTTEGGLDVAGNLAVLKQGVARLQDGGIPVSLFIDPVAAQVEAGVLLQVEAIEIHTGCYCSARGHQRQAELAKIAAAVEFGHTSGLRMLAGHGLNYSNIQAVVAIGGIEEFNIGHSIISRAVLVGLERAVREMAELVREA
ncbi:MAG: pyridoxine 5'-phosphate synthase [Desulfuromonas sp.]|nr:MAG: pyridoxine 5'-phosphate synthase [Desulfuromonas sp.]